MKDDDSWTPITKEEALQGPKVHVKTLESNEKEYKKARMSDSEEESEGDEKIKETKSEEREEVSASGKYIMEEKCECPLCKRVVMRAETTLFSLLMERRRSPLMDLLLMM